MLKQESKIKEKKCCGFIQHYFWFSKNSAGFTLMEIMVATTIFALLSTALMSLFNYTLKINRQSDALRQSTQGIRSMVETITKEIHNGQIDYSVQGGKDQANVTGCPMAPPYTIGAVYNGGNVYNDSETRLGIITSAGARECIYLNGQDLWISKEGNPTPAKLNPPNFQVQQLIFYIRPRIDPYYRAAPPKIQPFVSIMLYAKTKLPTGEIVPIYYQTALSTNKYDVLH